MSPPFIFIFNYHQDPSHGWVEVPAPLIDRLGILNGITEYSYYSHDRQVYYLEEDVDAALLFNSLKANGYEYVLKDIIYGNSPPLRRCSRVGSAE